MKMAAAGSEEANSSVSQSQRDEEEVGKMSLSPSAPVVATADAIESGKLLLTSRNYASDTDIALLNNTCRYIVFNRLFSCHYSC
jgi:hypothetical protein